MADPLSIAASVAGLLTTAGAIVSALTAFADAPQSARDAQQAVEEMRVVLTAVEGLVERVATLPARRRALVRLDYVGVTFASCVLTLSELESLVVVPSSSIQNRLRWLWSENKVLRLLPRIESQKNSLSLMVMVLTCQSQIEALESQDKLNAAVDQILQRDEQLAARLQGSESDVRSIKFIDRASTVDPDRLSSFIAPRADDPSVPPGSTPSGSQDVNSNADLPVTDSRSPILPRREFEVILDQSRVYTRSESNESDRSIASSAALSHAWSMFSLNDISIVSVFRLPITLADINVYGPGLTFTNLLDNPGLVIAVSQQQVRGTSADPNKVQRQEPLLRTDASLSPKSAAKSPVRERSPEPSRSHAEERSESRHRGLSPEHRTRKSPAIVDGSRRVPTIKLVVVGGESTEKRHTLITYTTNKFPKEYVPTVFDNYAVTIMIGNEPYVLGLFDTAGQEDFDRLRPLSYPQTDVFLVFCRIGLPYTYEQAREKWIPEIKHHCPAVPFIIVGIKHDDPDYPVLEHCQLGDNKEKGDTLAEQLGAVKYMECDIVTQQGLKEIFDEAIVAALEPPIERKRSTPRRSWRPGFLKGMAEIKE